MATRTWSCGPHWRHGRRVCLLSALAAQGLSGRAPDRLEVALPGADGRLVAAAAADAGGGKEVAWIPGFDDARRWLSERLREGDLLVVMGAGNVDALGRELVVSS